MIPLNRLQVSAEMGSVLTHLPGMLAEMLELATIGPFSWIRSSEEAPPRIFDVPESRKCGVYLFTVPTARGHLIYWVGQTSQAIGTRLATHSREFLAGTYNVLDMADLHDGKRTVRWRGLWWRKCSVDRYEEYLTNAHQVAPLTLAQLQATRIYVIPTAKDRRFLARLEAFIVSTLCQDLKWVRFSTAATAWLRDGIKKSRSKFD